MERIIVENDITVFYITASSFPEGIMDAHQQLHMLVPFSTNRKYFGISRPENGVIVYRAGAEELIDGEAKKLNCDTLVLKNGNYICLTVTDYVKDLQSIDKAFKKLLAHSGIDPKGYCVEWYQQGKDVKCMIRLQE